MLKALFLLALAWLVLALIRRRAGGDLASGLRELATTWAAFVHPSNDPLFVALSRFWPVVVAIAALTAAAYARSSYGVLTGDGFAWIQQSRRLDPSLASTFVSPFYNFGWPGVLRVGTEFGWTELQTARLASAVFATIAVFFACLIARWAAPPRIFVCSALAVAPVLSSYASLGSTDLPAASLQLAAIWFALNGHNSSALLSGISLGLAYLFRHQALLLVPPLLFLVARRSVREWRAIALFSCGLLAASSPQLIATWAVTGNPLWSEQTKNILFGLHGGGELRDWAAFPVGRAPTLGSVLGAPNLAGHWLSEIAAIPSLNTTILVAMASACLLERRQRRVILLAIAALYCLPIAVAWIEPRFILVATAATSFIDGYWLNSLALLFETIALWPLRHTVVRHRVADLLLLAVLLGNAVRPIHTPPLDPKSSLYDAVSTCLTQLGAQDPSSILSLSPVQTDVRMPAPLVPFVLPPPTDPARALASASNPSTTTVLLDPEFLPSDPTVRAAIGDLLAADFSETCSAYSSDRSLRVSVLSRVSPTAQPARGGV